VSEAMGGIADASAVSSYDLRRDGFSVVSRSVPTTETSACWIAVTPDRAVGDPGALGVQRARRRSDHCPRHHPLVQNQRPDVVIDAIRGAIARRGPSDLRAGPKTHSSPCLAGAPWWARGA
jgi:hypothetical protein